MLEKKSGNNELTLTLTMRQVSLIITGLLATCFFIFIAGYFFGQKRAVQDFSYKLEQDSLADQIYSSMCILSDTKDENEDSGETVEETEAPQTTSTQQQPQENNGQENVTQIDSQKKYRAIIAGFSASNVSDGKNLVAHLTSNGYPSELMERFSRTSHGKTIVWYQVVTKPYFAPNDLEQIISKVAKLAHVKEKSISIEECA